jgi:phage terminase large subunit-like protein
MWFFHFFGEPQNKQFESAGVRFDASSQTLLSVLIDELHAHKTPDLYGVLETAIGARLQPLILSITTAGFVTTGICISKILEK